MKRIFLSVLLGFVLVNPVSKSMAVEAKIDFNHLVLVESVIVPNSKGINELKVAAKNSNGSYQSVNMYAHTNTALKEFETIINAQTKNKISFNSISRPVLSDQIMKALEGCPLNPKFEPIVSTNVNHIGFDRQNCLLNNLLSDTDLQYLINSTGSKIVTLYLHGDEHPDKQKCTPVQGITSSLPTTAYALQIKKNVQGVDVSFVIAPLDLPCDFKKDEKHENSLVWSDLLRHEYGHSFSLSHPSDSLIKANPMLSSSYMSTDLAAKKQVKPKGTETVGFSQTEQVEIFNSFENSMRQQFANTILYDMFGGGDVKGDKTMYRFYTPQKDKDAAVPIAFMYLNKGKTVFLGHGEICSLTVDIQRFSSNEDNLIKYTKAAGNDYIYLDMNSEQTRLCDKKQDVYIKGSKTNLCLVTKHSAEQLGALSCNGDLTSEIKTIWQGKTNTLVLQKPLAGIRYFALELSRSTDIPECLDKSLKDDDKLQCRYRRFLDEHVIEKGGKLGVFTSSELE